MGENSKNRFLVGSGVKNNLEQKYLLIGGGGPSGDGLDIETDVGLGLVKLFPLLAELLLVVGVLKPSDPDDIRLSLGGGSGGIEVFGLGVPGVDGVLKFGDGKL